jgi:hypothetical protein
MRRQEINALMSAGTAAENSGRMGEAKACAEALIQALRDARAERQSDGEGTRAADLEALSWAMDVIQGTASGTPV